MRFDLAVDIDRPPAEVFAFLRDKDRHPRPEGSPVLVLERTTAGWPGVGTRYREVVQMAPFVKGEIRSQLTRYEPDRALEEDFAGAGMEGHLAYELLPRGSGTRLLQHQTLEPTGALKLLAPIIRRMFARRLERRLEGIKAALERSRA